MTNNYQQPINYANAFTYGQPQVSPEWTNPLTPEGEKLLKQKAPEFNVLDVTREEALRATCTHRDPATKTLTIVDTGTGSYRCTKCGAEFNVVDFQDEATVEQYTNGFVDILQTMKMMYVDLPPATVTAFFQMIPFIEKTPKMYTLSQQTFKRANGNNGIQPGYATSNPWDMLNHAVSSPMYPYQQPGYGYQQPLMQQPAYGYQQPVNGGNPFMPTPGTAPMQQPMPGYGYQQPPMQQAPAQQPQIPQNNQPQAATSVQQNEAKPAPGETVTTNKQFSL